MIRIVRAEAKSRQSFTSPRRQRDAFNRHKMQQAVWGWNPMLECEYDPIAAFFGIIFLSVCAVVLAFFAYVAFTSGLNMVGVFCVLGILAMIGKCLQYRDVINGGYRQSTRGPAPVHGHQAGDPDGQSGELP